MKKPTYRQIRRKMEPASLAKEENKEQPFFGSEPPASFFSPATDIQRQAEAPEDEEQVQRQAEEEREHEETAVQTSPEEDQEAP